jgi:predicted DCC family thiol-disulfide oxidoreductase YuxK
VARTLHYDEETLARRSSERSIPVFEGMGTVMIPWTLLYDEDCGFCRWSVDVVLRLDRRERLIAVPIQSPRGQDLLSSIQPNERLASWHLRTPSGAIESAGAAVAPLLRLLPFGAMPAAIARRLPRTIERAYRWVARHRTAFGALVGRSACAVDPSRRTMPQSDPHRAGSAVRMKRRPEADLRKPGRHVEAVEGARNRRGPQVSELEAEGTWW